MAFTTPWPICAACQSIPLSTFQCESTCEGTHSINSHFLHASLPNLQKSASTGCHVCFLLYEAVREPFKSRLKTAPIYIESMVGERDGYSVVVTADLSQMVRQEDSLEMGLSELAIQAEDKRFGNTPIADVKFTFDVEDIPAAAKNFKGLISLYPHDPGAVNYVRRSLDVCLKDHKYSCEMVVFPHGTSQYTGSINIVHGKNGMAVAPTRLVDVGSDGPHQPVRIVPGKHCLRDGRNYLVLSYCNGLTPKGAPWQLTSTTKARFEDDLPLNVLPQTLYDAIMWTRRLGERFIWIDNLCIVQDSAEDWEREASRMASIYGSALLTLVAASGSIYGGMTDRQNPLRNTAAALKLSNTKHEPLRATVYILPNGQKGNTALPAPTGDRAWCYQEDVLSPRIIKFSLKEVEWQCLATKFTLERAQGLEQLGGNDPYRWYTIWYRLIERYSRKQITYPTDKLPAFSGIAASKSTGDYLAGILKKDIWASMLWLRDTNLYTTQPGRRYESYIAPSWSWASIDAPVLFPSAQRRAGRKKELPATLHDPQLHDAEVERSTFNLMGAVKGGTIELTASSTEAITTSASLDLFTTSPHSHGQSQGRRRLRAGSDGPVTGEIIFDVAYEARDGLNVCCVLLQVTELDAWVKTGIAGVGLALQVEPGDRARPTYKRIGYIQYSAAFSNVSRQLRVTVS